VVRGFLAAGVSGMSGQNLTIGEAGVLVVDLTNMNKEALDPRILVEREPLAALSISVVF
jgi:hypothetical protein